MATSKVMTGARAQVFVNGLLVGLFDSCSYSVNIGAEPVHILGKYDAAEITQTSYEAVTVNCSGFRIIGKGLHVLPQAPKLKDLLNLEYITLSIQDRATGGTRKTTPAGTAVTERTERLVTTILTVDNCIPVSYGSGINAKATSRIQITYMGTACRDESGDSGDADSSTLP